MNEEIPPVSNEQIPGSSPPKKSGMGLGKKILLWVVGPIVVFVGGVGLLAFFSTREAADNTREFVDHLVVQDYDSAYALFSAPLKEIVSREQFESDFESAPFDDSCHFVTSGLGTQSGESGSSRTVSGRIECDSGTFASTFTYIDDNGEERLAEYQVNPEGVPLEDDEESLDTSN